MTTDTILTVAKAAYRSYFAGRLTRTWGAECFPVQGRWLRVAALVLNGRITRAPDLRFRYFEGYFERGEGVRPWEDVPQRERDRWARCLRVMQAVAATAQEAA